MVRPFTIPLNGDDLAILVTLPKLQGYVVAPKYYPHHLREFADREFLAWCETHPPRDWPQWVAEWHLEYQTTKRAAPSAPGGA